MEPNHKKGIEIVLPCPRCIEFEKELIIQVEARSIIEAKIADLENEKKNLLFSNNELHKLYHPLKDKYIELEKLLAAHDNKCDCCDQHYQQGIAEIAERIKKSLDRYYMNYGSDAIRFIDIEEAIKKLKEL